MLAVSATVSEKQAASTTAAAKELASVEENGTSKESPNFEDASLPERYTRNGTLSFQIEIRTKSMLVNKILLLKFAFNFYLVNFYDIYGLISSPGLIK